MQLTRLNVVIDPRSAWASVHGPQAELDVAQDSLRAWAARLVRGSSWGKGREPQAVCLRQSPEHLEVLLGAMLAVGHQVEWERGLPDCQAVRRYSAAVAARRALPITDPAYLRDYQASAVLAALQAPWGRSILSMPMASGKTRVACAIASTAGGSWVYLAPNRELARQTEAEAPSNLHCYSYGTALPSVLLLADGVIVDECHRISAESYAKVLMRCRATHRIGMSGTALLRSDDRNALVIGLLGPVCYQVTMEDLSSCNAISHGVVRNVLI